MRITTAKIVREMLNCGHRRTPNGCAYGVAHTIDGYTLCLPCAAEDFIASLTWSHVAVAYVASDGKSVTTWDGVKLGTIVGSQVTHRGTQRHVWVRDVHGARWYGVGPEESGTYTRMRKVKG